MHSLQWMAYAWKAQKAGLRRLRHVHHGRPDAARSAQHRRHAGDRLRRDFVPRGGEGRAAFGLLLFIDRMGAFYEEKLRFYGLAERFVGALPVGFGFNDVLAGFDQPGPLIDRFRVAARRLIDAGADVIIPAEVPMNLLLASEGVDQDRRCGGDGQPRPDAAQRRGGRRAAPEPRGLAPRQAARRTRRTSVEVLRPFALHGLRRIREKTTAAPVLCIACPRTNLSLAAHKPGGAVRPRRRLRHHRALDQRSAEQAARPAGGDRQPARRRRHHRRRHRRQGRPDGYTVLYTTIGPQIINADADQSRCPTTR